MPNKPKVKPISKHADGITARFARHRKKPKQHTIESVLGYLKLNKSTFMRDKKARSTMLYELIDLMEVAKDTWGVHEETRNHKMEKFH